MPFSFWEYNHYQNTNPFIIIGGGIVGLSTAIEIKNKKPNQEVIVVEKFFPPMGASTKNAGFACFGGITEILDDLNNMNRNEVIEIVKMRWEGIKILDKRLKTKNVFIQFNGGKELFKKDEFVTDDNFNLCNQLMFEATGVDNYYERVNNDEFLSLNSTSVAMKSEGELDAMQMLTALQEIAIENGVKFIYGHSLIDINFNNKEVLLSESISLKYDKLFICTNGFTRKIFPELEVVPARNHVLITKPISGLNWNGVYHYDKGYYYFRRVGDRVLLGGARNFDAHNEFTSDFDFNEKIKNELIRFLEEDLIPDKKVEIDKWWTGILGVGKSKYPILEEFEKDCYVGVRLGGMGVAIGSYLGKKLVNMSME